MSAADYDLWQGMGMFRMSGYASSAYEGRRDRTLAVASQWPVLIGKTMKTVVTENEMVKQSDAQQVSSFPQAYWPHGIAQETGRDEKRTYSLYPSE